MPDTIRALRDRPKQLELELQVKNVLVVLLNTDFELARDG